MTHTVLIPTQPDPEHQRQILEWVEQRIGRACLSPDHFNKRPAGWRVYLTRYSYQEHYRFEFKDAQIAMLFKLTWA